ncbi:DUF3179 domain-containing protein [Chelativorans salis]|uniref:DUF3179 domain-containing protein n=1 Tax=Chelativorans salis TaxID=2978478 RepID=A0ABT2LTR2_9HYPH|nr:DUF3179 domain-containing protein [Chelativorans sp. EGI FJ00035]MCT7377927.1 DUF3179 domain-containing protein [Chelativorans sp. EGI FJ00035]
MLTLVRIFVLSVPIVAAAAQAIADPTSWSREGWETDFSKSSVPFEEIISGGPPRDGIPSIDDPKFAAASAVPDIEAREPVIQFGLGGDIRAYPLRVLTWHEIVNDVVGGVPVAVTYCPLCNAALVFDRRLDDRVLEFGTTGKLRNSDLVMYDRQTESWWQQFTGEAIVGTLNGRKLKLLPSRIVAFSAFREAYSGGPVLVPNDPSFRDYGRNPYASYDSSATPFLYRGDLPEDIPAMARVVVVRTQDEPIIVTLDRVRAGTLERDGYRIEFEEGVASALDHSTIAKGRDVGTVRVTRDGRDVVHDVTFAFVAHAFHPDVPIIGK